MNELATKPRAKADLLDRLEMLALRPEIDVGKLKALLDLQERVMAQRAEMAFTEAFTALSSELPRIRKTGHAHVVTKSGGKMGYSYARWDDMDATLRPLLTKHGFSLSFATSPGPRPATVCVRGVLSHHDGFSRTGEMELPFDASGGKNPVQGVGSALSYGRRYVAVMLLNIVVEDDDDDAGSIDAKGKSKRNFDRPTPEAEVNAAAEALAQRAVPSRELFDSAHAKPIDEEQAPLDAPAAPFTIHGPKGKIAVETPAEWVASWQDVLEEERPLPADRRAKRAKWLIEKNLDMIDEVARHWPEEAEVVRRGLEALCAPDAADGLDPDEASGVSGSLGPTDTAEEIAG